MKPLRRWTRPAAIALSCLLVACGSAATNVADQHQQQCSLGTPTGEERQLIAPRPGTFYSVDVLNPDMVVFHGQYFLYFSGNDRHTAEGNWRTGLAISRSPTGPFRIQKNLLDDYLNGGTTVWHGRLWHVVEDNPVDTTDIRGELANSSDGIHWHHQAFLPGFTLDGVTYHGADFFLEPEGSQLGVYMLAVPPNGGIGRSLGFASYADGHWSPFHMILSIKSVADMNWSSADLGEPATFYAAGRRYLLFVGLARKDLTRSIGLAQESKSAWTICNDEPAISNTAHWGPASSIDPSPVVVGSRLYLYYGATHMAGLASNLGGSIGLRVFLIH
jgi:hypothetical protein